MNKKITILLPVYNGEKHVRKAIESIFTQTFLDFELLVINDGSSDKTVSIIESFTDKRLRLLNNETNIGLIKTLNKGIHLAEGEYIARMDADDICYTKRLEEQVKFMDANPDIGISGTWTKAIGKNQGYATKYFTHPDEIKSNFLFFSTLAHPTVIFRRKLFIENNLFYDEDFKHAEDFELWSRALTYTKIANIPKVLLFYRMHNESMSNKYSTVQSENANRVLTRQLKKLDINPNNKEIIIHRQQRKPKELSIKEFLNQKEAWLNQLITQNDKFKIYKEPYFSQIIAKNWLDTCRSNTSEGVFVLKRCLSSKLIKIIPAKNYVDILKLAIKSI